LPFDPTERRLTRRSVGEPNVGAPVRKQREKRRGAGSEPAVGLVDADAVVVVSQGVGRAGPPRRHRLVGLGGQGVPEPHRVGRLLGPAIGVAFGLEILTVDAHVDDNVDPRVEPSDIEVAVPLGIDRGRVAGRRFAAALGHDQVEPVVGVGREGVVDDPTGLVGRRRAEHVADQESAGAIAAVGDVDPSVRDRGEDAVFVVADPGPAGLGVPRREERGIALTDRRGLRRPAQAFVAVRGDDDRRVVEDAPPERQRAHSRY
jgi:hypothetical protein